MREGNAVRNREYPNTETANGGLGELHQAEINFLKFSRGVKNADIHEMFIRDGLPTFGKETIVYKQHKFI